MRSGRNRPDDGSRLVGLDRALFAHAPDPILMADAEGRYVDANPAASALLGYARGELLALRVADVVAAAPTWTEAEYARFRREGRWRGDVTLRRKDGALVPVEVHSFTAPLDGELAHVAILRDLGTRREHEAERRHLAELVAAAEERERIAMDLHDGALATLSAVSIGVGTAARLLPGEPRRAAALIGRASTHLRRAIDAIRGYVADLDPSPAGLSLRAALAGLAAETRAASIAVDLDVAPRADEVGASLGGGRIVELLQVAREAVANALRHGAPTRVAIALAVDDQAVVLSVRDDGRGFDPAAPVDGRHGLANMAERARRIGDRLEVASHPGAGTEVRLVTPLVADDGSAPAQ